MMKFKEFLSEQEMISIENVPDKNILRQNLDSINNDLDAVTDKPFKNNIIFINAIRGTLERYGILIPSGYETYATSLEAEIVYSLGDENEHSVYVTFNPNEEGLVDGYAQIVDDDELNDLLNMQDDSDYDMPHNQDYPSKYLTQARKSDD